MLKLFYAELKYKLAERIPHIWLRMSSTVYSQNNVRYNRNIFFYFRPHKFPYFYK